MLNCQVILSYSSKTFCLNFSLTCLQNSERLPVLLSWSSREFTSDIEGSTCTTAINIEPCMQPAINGNGITLPCSLSTDIHHNRTGPLQMTATQMLELQTNSFIYYMDSHTDPYHLLLLHIHTLCQLKTQPKALLKQRLLSAHSIIQFFGIFCKHTRQYDEELPIAQGLW